MAKTLTYVIVTLAVLSFVVYVQSQITGGLHDERDADEETRNLINKLKPEIEKKAAKEFKSIEPLRYRSQTVAGKNYFIKVRTTDQKNEKAFMHVRIYKPFRGPAELTAVMEVPDESHPIKYFQ